MKILQVTPRYPPQSGGVETHVKEISERLVERGHKVTVISADKEGKRREQRNGVSVRRYRSIAPNGAMHFCPQIAAAVRRSDADIVHAHNYHSFPLSISALSLAVQWTSIPFVATPHYHAGSDNSLRDRLLSLYAPLGRWALRRAAAVIAVSEWERRRLHTDFGIEATEIPNGLDVDQFRTATPESRERPYLLTVGRLVEYKGVQHAIRALTDPQLAEFDLVVAGSGPYRDQLESIAAEAGVANRVTFAGYVDDDRLPRLYTGASVFLSLSTVEAYGMTVAESLAAGTPCVVRNAGALSDWVNREGCVGISEPIPKAVAAGITAVRNKAPSTEGLLSWDTVVENLETVYDEVCRSGTAERGK